MNQDNPQATVEWMTQEFFNQLLVALTKLNKPVKAQELAEVLHYSKQIAARCADVVRNEPSVMDSETRSIFWNAVYHKLNQ